MTKRKVAEILRLLDEHYGAEAVCYLDYDTPWQLLFATILSAQCTDARVNLVTKELFAAFPALEDAAGAELCEIERIVKPAGLYRVKSKNILGCARLLVSEHGGKVPRGINELTRLPGVGRKTANVVRGHVFNEPCVVVDTHVKRVSNKLGLTAEQNPDKIELDLMRVLPKEHWLRFNTQAIAHGRAICKAPNPRCTKCFLAEHCGNIKK